MLTVKAKDINYTNGKNRVEGECLSADAKPSNVANGSMLLEMDTGDIYCFDGANEQWIKLGGGSSGGDSVTITFRNNTGTDIENGFGYAESIEAGMGGQITQVSVSAQGTAEVTVPMDGVIFWDDLDTAWISYDEQNMEMKYIEIEGQQLPYLEVHGSGMVEYGQIS